MPITIAQMAANEKSLSTTIDGQTLNLVYFPGKVTTKILNVFDSGLDGQNQALSEIIKSWDVQVSPDDSSMYPLDADSLAALGIQFLRQVTWAILEDIRPN